MGKESEFYKITFDKYSYHGKSSLLSDDSFGWLWFNVTFSDISAI